MGNIIEDINFEERRELILLKAISAWVKLRFSGPMGFHLPKEASSITSQLLNVDQMKKVGIISDEDAWTIEENSLLFNATVRSYLQSVLTKELFANFGEIRCGANRKRGIVDIALYPITMGNPKQASEVLPCTMYITKKAEIVKRFKENTNYYTTKHVDVIPFIKTQLANILSKEEHAIIADHYHKYKNDPDVIKSREAIQEKKRVEDKNLKSALTAISVQGKRTEIVKLAVTIFTIIKGAYKTGHQNLTKIKFDNTGASTVPDFSRIFYVDYDVDLEEVKGVLEAVVDADLKVHLGDKRILFTTVNGLDPNDDVAMEKVVSAKILDEDGLDHIFETLVGPQTSIDDVHRILDRFLQRRYN